MREEEHNFILRHGNQALPAVKADTMSLVELSAGWPAVLQNYLAIFQKFLELCKILSHR